uniref:Uncharacterized protein n=1 Tax=Setaria italica TaxID=4555 RepID=K4AJT4_SETIT
MMGALAWQATVIKMLILCLGWEIARGVIFFIPRVLPPLVSLCPLLLVGYTSPWYTSGILQFGKELQRRTQGTIGNLKLQFILHTNPYLCCCNL